MTATKAATKTTGIKWDAVRAELDGMDWEHDECESRYERMLFLGTVFSLYPSGKYYMPWACSNLDPCPVCGGDGKAKVKAKRRVVKKWRAKYERYRRLVRKHPGYYIRHNGTPMDCYYKTTASCPHCHGIGSREAYLDGEFQEMLESEASDHGLFVTSGEGDPCDIFVGEGADETDCHDCGATIREGDEEHECEPSEDDDTDE